MSTTGRTTQITRQTTTMAALRHTNFRWYIVGQLISISGSWMQITAQGWLVYHLTGSELWLGIVACAGGIPAFFIAPFAGVLLDRFPKRYALLISNTILMVQAILMAFLVLTNTVQVWHIVALALVGGIGNSLDAPARHSIVGDLVGRDDLSSGVAMNAMMYNGSRIFGPALAGIFLTQFGAGWCFAVNAFSFIGVMFILIYMQVPFAKRPTVTLSPIAELRAGLAYIRTDPIIRPLMLMAVVAAFLTGNISGMFPAFAAEELHSPKAGYAAIATAIGFGATIGALLSQPICNRFGRGRVVMVMAGVMVSIVALATRATVIPLAALGFGVYGISTVLQFVNYNTMVQHASPDEYRGRVMAIYTGVFWGLSPFGALLLGFISQGVGHLPAQMVTLTAAGLPMLDMPSAWIIPGMGTPNAMALYAILGSALSLYIAVRGRIWFVR